MRKIPLYILYQHHVQFSISFPFVDQISAIVLLASTCQANNQPHGEENDAVKQHRLFVKHSNWMIPQEESEEFPELLQDKPDLDQMENLFINQL